MSAATSTDNGVGTHILEPIRRELAILAASDVSRYERKRAIKTIRTHILDKVLVIHDPDTTNNGAIGSRSSQAINNLDDDDDDDLDSELAELGLDFDFLKPREAKASQNDASGSNQDQSSTANGDTYVIDALSSDGKVCVQHVLIPKLLPALLDGCCCKHEPDRISCLELCHEVLDIVYKYALDSVHDWHAIIHLVAQTAAMRVISTDGKTKETAEELRLQWVQLIGVTLHHVLAATADSDEKSQPTASIAETAGFLTDVMSHCSADLFPELKIEVAKLTQRVCMYVTRTDQHHVLPKLCAALKSNTTHQRYHVRQASVTALLCVIEQWTGDWEDWCNAVVQVLRSTSCDRSTVVRKDTATCVQRFVRSHVANTATVHSDFQGRMVLLLLALCVDEQSGVRQQASDAMTDVCNVWFGAIERPQVKTLPPSAPQGVDARAASVLVTQHLIAKLVELTEARSRSWTTEGRLHAAETLHALILHAQDVTDKYAARLFDCFLRMIQEDEVEVFRSVQAAVKSFSFFCKPTSSFEIILKLLSPASLAQGTSASTVLILLESLVSGVNIAAGRDASSGLEMMLYRTVCMLCTAPLAQHESHTVRLQILGITKVLLDRFPDMCCSTSRVTLAPSTSMESFDGDVDAVIIQSPGDGAGDAVIVEEIKEHTGVVPVVDSDSKHTSLLSDDAANKAPELPAMTQSFAGCVVWLLHELHSLADTQESEASSVQTLNRLAMHLTHASVLGDSKISENSGDMSASLYKYYFDDILASVIAQGSHDDETVIVWENNTVSRDLFVTLLERGSASVGDHLPEVVPALIMAGHSKNDPLIRMDVLRVLYKLIAGGQVAWKEWAVRLLTDLLVPNGQWSAGRAAAAIRMQAIACVNALFDTKAFITYDVGECRSMLLPLVMSNLDDDDVEIRINASQILRHMLDSHTAAVFTSDAAASASLASEVGEALLKRLDDASNTVRYDAIVTLHSLIVVAINRAADGKLLESEFVQNTAKRMIVHLDDDDPNIAKAVHVCIYAASRCSSEDQTAVAEIVSSARAQLLSSSRCDSLLAEIESE
jgi:hypothetical protein